MLRFKARRRQSPALKPQGELTASERRVIAMMGEAMEAVRRQVTRDLTRVADAVAHQSEGRVADLVTDEPWYEMQAALEAELLGELLDAGSRVELPAIQKATLKFAFDRDRPESAAWARQESASLVREITEGQRTAIRDVIVYGQERGLSPQDTARQIQQTVGLTSQQAGWVNNFNSRAVTQNLASGMSLDQAMRAAESATARYQSQIHRYRAMTIARTEIMRANSEGRQQAWGQGLTGGWISPTSQKEWIAEADACDICSPINGTRVPVTGRFPIGEPPAHPNCRCDVLLIPDAIPPDLAGMSDAQLDAQIAGLLGDALLPTVPTAGAQPATTAADDLVNFPGARRDFAYYADDNYAQLAKIADEFEDATFARIDPDNPFSGFRNEDKMLKALLDDQGFSGKGAIVDDDTFEVLRNDPRYEYLGRGLADDDAATVARYADDLIDGEVYAGRGLFGNGTYMSGGEDVLQNFAKFDAAGNEYAHGRIVDSLLKPNAKVIDFEDAYAQMEKTTDTIGAEWMRTRWGGEWRDTSVVMDDVGRWAVANGYDAIRIKDPYVGYQGRLVGTTYWNVLNRQALIFRSTARGRA